MNSASHSKQGRRATGTDGERVLDWLVLRPDLPPMQTLIVGSSRPADPGIGWVDLLARWATNRVATPDTKNLPPLKGRRLHFILKRVLRDIQKISAASGVPGGRCI